MKELPYIVATAGHVDHGKSAIVRALTGIDPDRLPEEKARGITIQLGFSSLLLDSPSGAEPARYRVGVVDVPGHEDFVKNMVAGVGSIDAALLVVAADDGWMPQTQEHLEILTYLGVRRGVIALSKIDLATSEDGSIAVVRAKLAGSPLADATIVPTSIVSGRGIEELRIALSEVLSRTPVQRDVGKPRLPLDRVFSVKGVGTIVTGTLVGGVLRRGQSIVVQPTGIASRVRTIQNHHREVDEAHPGSRVALNLPDLEPASGRSAREANTVARGDVVTLAELGIATMAIDVQLERAKRAGEAATSIRPLKHGSIVWIHHGSAATAARVHLHGRGTLQAGDCGLARLQLQSPAFIFIGDCFVIRDWPEQHTLAGGVVIDINRDGSPRDAQERTMLEARAANPGDARLAVESQITRDGITAQDKLLVQSRFSTDEITKAVSNLACENKVVIAGTNVIDAQFWSRARDVATKTVDHFHCEHPEKPGLNLTDLRKALEDIGAAEFMDALLAHLSADGFQRTGNVLRRTRHAPALPPRLQAAGEKLRKILKSRAFDPPSRKELAPDPISEQALRFLIINHEAIEIAPDIVMNSDAFLQGIAIVRGHLQRNGAATVSELKSALASSRRIMVPFLEKLDRDGITRREGDVRRLLGPAKVEATGASGRQ